MSTHLFDIYKLILDKILELFPEKKANAIYHYTTKEVFCELLKPNKDLYCTYCADLSDTTEVLIGMRTVGTIWMELCNDERSEFVRPIEYLCRMSGDSDSNLFPWTMSFSTERDDTRQWRLYTDRLAGGYSIGFSWDEMYEILSGKGSLIHGDKAFVSLFPCLYKGVDDYERIKVLVKFTLEEVVKEMKHFVLKRGEEDDRENIARTILFFLLASIIKHKDFKDEREWRLIVHPMDIKAVGGHIDIVGGKLRIRSGLFGNKNPIRKCLSEIVVSPHGRQDSLFYMAKIIIAARKQKGNQIKVVPSESPYRGGTEG